VRLSASEGRGVALAVTKTEFAIWPSLFVQNSQRRIP